MTKPKDELFYVTDIELEDIKVLALHLLEHLPKEPKTALLVITFLKQHIEETFGLSAKGIIIKSDNK